MWWILQRTRRNAEAEAKERDYEAFHAQIRAGGYREWAYEPPPHDAVVECRRLEWPGPKLITLSEVSQWMNVADLYWRHTGSQTIEGERQPPMIDGRL